MNLALLLSLEQKLDDKFDDDFFEELQMAQQGEDLTKENFADLLKSYLDRKEMAKKKEVARRRKLQQRVSQHTLLVC